MPEKDGSEDKKSTKSVVNKKQKQFMNQEEQLDLSSVAESFGGQIVGEPVELDEIAPAVAAAYYGGAALLGLGGYYLANRKAINKRMSDTISNIFTRKKTDDNIIWRDDTKTKDASVLQIKKRTNNQDGGGPSGGTKDRTINTKDLTPEINRRRKELDKNTADNTISNFFNRFRKNKNNNQSNKNKNNKSNKSTNLAIAGASGMGIQKTISTLTQGKKKGGGGFRMGGLPGTAHNVGRRSNPQ